MGGGGQLNSIPMISMFIENLSFSNFNPCFMPIINVSRKLVVFKF